MDINLLSANTICYSIIAKRISTRHWVADFGLGMGSCMLVGLYVCPLRFWNVSRAQHTHERDGNSICTANVHVFVCVRLHACAAIWVPGL